jgi:Uma2 family endonuclease
MPDETTPVWEIPMSVAEAPSPPRTETIRRHKWTIAEFDRLTELGFFREGGPAFLWDGEIFEPLPEKRPHANASQNLYDEVIRRVPSAEWTIDLGHPVALREGYKPQPDLAVLAGPRSKYRTLDPVPADVVLLVEIADTTATDDLGEVRNEYARSGIPQYWVVGIKQRCVWVYRDPDPSGRYRIERIYRLGEHVPLELAIPGKAAAFEPIAVEAILLDSLGEPEPGSPSEAAPPSS